jgi:hypothetical protein
MGQFLRTVSYAWRRTPRSGCVGRESEKLHVHGPDLLIEIEAIAAA